MKPTPKKPSHPPMAQSKSDTTEVANQQMPENSSQKTENTPHDQQKNVKKKQQTAQSNTPSDQSGVAQPLKASKSDPSKTEALQVETRKAETKKAMQEKKPEINQAESKKIEPTKPLTQKGVQPNAGFAPSKMLTIFALVLAGVAVTFSVLMWQRMEQMEQKLQASMDSSNVVSNAASTAKSLAQQSMDSSKDLQGKVSHLSAQIASFNEDSGRVDMLMQYISNSKTDMLPVNVRSMITSAELQMQLTGSVQPLLTALQSIDQRLAEDGLSEQTPLRNAIATDIENIRNFPMPDPMYISGQITELLDIVNKDAALLPLMIDRPTSTNSLSLDFDLGTGPLPADNQPSADTSTWGKIKSAGSWSVDKATEFGSAAWTQLGSLVEITPIHNKDAVLLSANDGALLRENIKMRLMGLRIAVLQKQYARAQKELLGIQGAFETYFDPNNKNIQDVLRRIRVINADLQNVSLPKPSATTSALAALSLNQ